jgi:S1-C subfamily serine protease
VRQRIHCFRILVLSICLFVLSASLTGQESRRSGLVGVTAAPSSGRTQAARRKRNRNPGERRRRVRLGQGCGIQPNDIITQLNDHKVIDVNDFVRTAKSLRAGDVAIVSVRRGSKHPHHIHTRLDWWKLSETL